MERQEGPSKLQLPAKGPCCILIPLRSGGGIAKVEPEKISMIDQHYSCKSCQSGGRLTSHYHLITELSGGRGGVVGEVGEWNSG